MGKFRFPKYIQNIFQWVFMNGFKLDDAIICNFNIISQKNSSCKNFFCRLEKHD